MLKTSCFFTQLLRGAAYVLLLIIISGRVQAELYKWVDENGHVHYGDCPPIDCNSESVHIPSPPSQDEVERAHQRLDRYQDIIHNLRGSKKSSPLNIPPSVKLIPQNTPCFEPLGHIISGPSGGMFTPITPTILKKKQQQYLARIFHKLDTHWRKGEASITICEDTPEGSVHKNTIKYSDKDARVEIDTNSSENQLMMKLKWYDNKENIGGRNFINLATGDRLYLTKDSNFQNIKLQGNSVEIAHLDKRSILFMVKPRIRAAKGSLPYPEVRYLVVYDNKWTLTELYYANNKLRERIDWVFRKSLN